MSDTYFKTKKSPCVGLCSTTYGDNVCRGCLRTVGEVLSWTTYTDEQKDQIQLRLQQQVEDILKLYIHILQPDEFIIVLKKKSFLYFSQSIPTSEYYLLFQLIQTQPDELKNYRKYFEILKPIPALKIICSQLFDHALQLHQDHI